MRRVATEVAVMLARWFGAGRQRFAEEGPDGLLRDKTRKPGKPPILAGTVARVVALTCGDPPVGVTHWTGRAMAKVAGISLPSVQRIWDANQLQPHRVRSFKRSRDPRFAEKMADVVGLYLDPPAHAVVLSIDEKSQIQALDRTQPGLPLKPGRCGTMTHDYKRHGRPRKSRQKSSSGIEPPRLSRRLATTQGIGPITASAIAQSSGCAECAQATDLNDLRCLRTDTYCGNIEKSPLDVFI